MSVTREAGRTMFGAGRRASTASRTGRRRWAARVLGAMLALGVIGAVCTAFPLLFDGRGLTVPVERGDLVISLTGYGVVESRDNLDIKCEVPGSLSLLEIVRDGSIVRAGDLLARLDSTALEQAIAAQKRALAKAESAAAQAKKELQAAKKAIDAYREGTFVQEGLRYDRDILLAKKSLAAAEHSLLQSQIAHRRGFGARVHVEAREFVVETARANLTAARHKKEVLEEFTGPKTIEDLESKSVAAEARWQAGEVIVDREKVRLRRLLDDLSRCMIRAPRDGMVVYAGGAMDAEASANRPVPQIYAGAKLRQHQTLLRLADLDQLQIKLLVSEKKIAHLRRGQRVHVKVLDQRRRGEIVAIADQPQVSSVADIDFRQYAVGIAVDAIAEQWKPGMTAEVDVLIEQKKNVLSVPVVCVVKHGGEPHVRVKSLAGTALREVMLGMTNDIVVEIVDGVNEGEMVLLNPGVEGEHPVE